MILTCKIRIYPTKKQKRILWNLSERCRLLYNFSLLERKIIWQQEKIYPIKERKFITYQDQQNALPALKKRYPEYQWVYSKVLQMTLKTLDSNFKSFFTLWKKGDRTAQPPKFKGKKHFFSLKYNQSGFKLAGNILTLSHKHPSKVELSLKLQYYPKNTSNTIKQVDLYYNRVSDHWSISLSYDAPVPAYRDNGLYQAFDPGINNIVAAVNLQGNLHYSRAGDRIITGDRN